MPISDYTRRQMQIACGSVAAGDNVVVVIDADGGTMNVDSRTRLRVAMGSQDRATQVADAIDADGAFSAYERQSLQQVIGQPAAAEIATEQGG
jgi:hypothetical protein